MLVGEVSQMRVGWWWLGNNQDTGARLTRREW